MSEYITAALAVVASLVIVSGCSRQDTHSGAPGSEVVFSAGTGSQQTKTSYGETSSGGTQAINWTEGDKIRIYSPQAYLRDKSSQHWADYKASGGGTSSSIVNDAANGLVWSEEGSHTFCGIYSSPAVNDSSIYVTESESFNVITATMPKEQTVTKLSESDTLYNPDMKYAYMYAGASVSGTSSTVGLTFNPMFTAFELEVGTTASSTTLTGFEMTADVGDLSGEYKGTVNCSENSISYGTLPSSDPKKGVTVSFGSGVTLTKGHYIRFTVFVIPQTFNITTSGGLTLQFTTSGGTKTMTLKTKTGTQTFNSNEKFNIKAIDLPSFNLKSADNLSDYGQPKSQTGGGGLSDYTLPAMTGITISSESETIDVGSTVTLSYTVQPTGAEVKSAVWSSSNTGVATVSDGVVTGVSAGPAAITITVTDTYSHTFYRTCSVTVTETAPTYTEGSYTGQGIKIGGIWWAPVNCGYDATNYPYGKLYQWGREDGCGYNKTWTNISGQTVSAETIVQSTVTGPIAASSESSSYFYTNSSSPNDWLSTANPNRWDSSGNSSISSSQKVTPTKTAYDPCPAGWRVPTYYELNVLYSAKIADSYDTGDGTIKGFWFGTSTDKIFLPTLGYRSSSDGSFYSRGSIGFYWSSSVNGNYACPLRSDSDVGSLDGARGRGGAVRCVKE